MASYLPNEVNKLAFASAPRASKPLGGFLENLQQAFSAGLMQSGSSEERYIKDAWDPIVEEIQDVTGMSFKNPGSYLRPNVFEIVSGEAARYYGPQRYDFEIKQIERYVKENQDVLPENIVNTVLDTERDTIWRQEARNKYFSEQGELAELMNRSPGLGPASGRLLGFLGSGAEDPINQAFMLLPAARVGKGFLGLVFGEALTNATVEAIQQPGVKDWYESLGLEYTWEDFVTNVGSAGIIGGAFPIGIKIGGKTIGLTVEQARKGAQVLSRGKKTDIQQAAEILEEATQSIGDSNPLQKTAAGELEHQSRLTEATIAINDGEMPKLSDNTKAQVTIPDNINQATNLGGVVDEFNPRDINVDAKTFQFKEGGDIYGVTDRLEGVTEFDPIKAGMITVYEYADGRLFIADGHQRLGLAKRIMDQDPNQNIKMVGHRLREKDGYTPEEATVIAALKNIAEGTGTVIDAAKILRINPDRIVELPPKSAFVRQARDLSQLSDDAWGMVKNEIVAPNYAAIVGRLMADDATMQKAALDVLSKTEPSNEFQAEAIVRQVRETELVSETQENLFGEEVLTQSLFAERAKVLDRAQKQLRKDKNSFQNLIKNADRLEDEGNKLANEANKRRATNDGKAISLLQSQANRKGSLSEALTAAARQAKETGNYNRATTSFVEDVRRAISDGEFDRAEIGDAGRAFDAPEEIPQIRTDAEEIELDKFDNLFGEGVEEQARILDAGLRQDLDVDLEKLDFEKQLKNSVSYKAIINHPYIRNAVEDMETRPQTDKMPGYPKDENDVEGIANWVSQRQYIVDGSNNGTFDDAMRDMVKTARSLGWIDDKIELPANAIRKEKKAVIILGPPAAGKSTLANPIARKMGASIVDADEAKKLLPEYEGGIGANAIHEESSLMSDILLKTLLEEGDNLVLPKVGGKAESIERAISMIKQKGYSVEVVDMAVSFDNAMQRMLQRFVSKGRLINPEYVIKVGENPSKTFDTIQQKGIADGYYRIDNNGPQDGYKEVLTETGELLKDTSIRLRRGGVESGPEVRRTGRKVSVGEISESFEELDTPTISESLLDEKFPLESLDEIDDLSGEPKINAVTARQLLDEINQDDAMVDAISRCPL
jgi:adenylate kinase family enzyme|tara:strand:+ start:2058 stop:5405 length:3348 start_codon:yes stop_codon:yes gene_type:complete